MAELCARVMYATDDALERLCALLHRCLILFLCGLCSAALAPSSGRHSICVARLVHAAIPIDGPRWAQRGRVCSLRNGCQLPAPSPSRVLFAQHLQRRLQAEVLLLVLLQRRSSLEEVMLTQSLQLCSCRVNNVADRIQSSRHLRTARGITGQVVGREQRVEGTGEEAR